MAEDTATLPAPSDKMEEVSGPSTSAEPVEGCDIDAEAKKFMASGTRFMVLKDFRSAVNSFQEACSHLGKKYGETADECGEALYFYGLTLLEVARLENNVLGNALEGIPEEDDECEKDDPNIPSADNLDGEEAESDENEEPEEKEEEDKDEEDKDEDDLKLSWEVLELAKLIFKRKPDKCSQLKAAQAHLKLGEVSIESENYSQAVEDFLACLTIQKEHLEEHDRLLAETHYQLGLAYQYSSRHQDAITHFTQSIDVIEKRLAVLTEQLEKAEESKEETQKEMEELKGLLPDIKEKIEDSKEAKKTAEDTLKETLVGTSSDFPKENGGTSSSTSTAAAEKSGDCTVPVTNCVSDISHLVRKKRKPEEESPQKEAKKCKSEPVENGAGNGDAVVPTSEQVEKAEEAENQTPMETAAVESTA